MSPKMAAAPRAGKSEIVKDCRWAFLAGDLLGSPDPGHSKWNVVETKGNVGCEMI